MYVLQVPLMPSEALFGNAKVILYHAVYSIRSESPAYQCMAPDHVNLDILSHIHHFLVMN